MSNPAQNSPEDRLKELEIEFKLDSFHRRRPRQIIEEAAELCLEHEINYPPWVDFWHLHRDPFAEHTSSLKKAVEEGNLGALKDMVYWSDRYNEPLPKWATQGLYDALNTLAKADKPKLKAWRAWFRGYKQKQADIEVYETVKEARGEYLEKGDDRKLVEWGDAREVAGAIIANEPPVDTKSRENTIKKAYGRAIKGLKNNPLQYMQLQTFRPKPKDMSYNPNLWTYIQDTVKSGNPRKKRNSKKT